MLLIPILSAILSGSVAAHGAHPTHSANGADAPVAVEAEPTQIAPRAPLSSDVLSSRRSVFCSLSNLYGIGFPSPPLGPVYDADKTDGLVFLPTENVCTFTTRDLALPTFSKYYMSYSEFLDTAQDKAGSLSTDFCGEAEIRYSLDPPCTGTFTLIGTPLYSFQTTGTVTLPPITT
ncbi:hypothetical protein K4F52_001261, partial [Lecanicillium sp. MT-2017a]